MALCSNEGKGRTGSYFCDITTLGQGTGLILHGVKWCRTLTERERYTVDQHLFTLLSLLNNRKGKKAPYTLFKALVMVCQIGHILNCCPGAIDSNF